MSDPRDPNDAYIPADDVILRGYCGPVGMLGLRIGVPDLWVTTAYGSGGMANGADYKRLRLDPTLAPVRDHIARVMAEGMRCAHDCDQWPQRANMSGHEWTVCSRCGAHTSKGEVGHLLPPAPIEHLLDRPGSKLTAAQSAVLVAWSYRSWRGGGAVLRGVLATYYDAIDNGWGRVDCVGAGVSVGVFPRARGNRQGWYVIFHGTDDTPDIEVSGHETGPEGRACADRAALAHNVALLNEDGSVTTPELLTETK